MFVYYKMSFKVFTNKQTPSAYHIDNRVNDPNPNIPFVSEWVITDDKKVGLLFPKNLSCNFTINWGDGNTKKYKTKDIFLLTEGVPLYNNNIDIGPWGLLEHTYTDPNTYKITISGIVPSMSFNPYETNIPFSVSSLGNLGWLRIDYMFANSGITSLNTNGLQYSPASEAALMCFQCSNLTSFNTIGFKNIIFCSGAWVDCISLTSFNTIGLSNVNFCVGAWNGCSGLTSFNTVGLINVISCKTCWEGCIGLTSFNTVGLSNVIDCSDAWYNCTNLASFNAVGLSNVLDCTTAWVDAGPFTTFSNIPVSLITSTGWNLGTSPNIIV
jgi:hypothetical protein